MDLSQHLKKMITSLKTAWEVTVKYDSSANLDEYLKMALEIVELDFQNEHELEVIESATGVDTEEEFDTIVNGSDEPDYDADTAKGHPFYKEFETFARNVLQKKLLSSSQTVTQTTVSNDMEITETCNAIDPITKGPLIRPVRNKNCNHIYGYQSVMDSLEINRRLRCPMIGCSNKSYIVPQDLVEL